MLRSLVWPRFASLLKLMLRNTPASLSLLASSMASRAWSMISPMLSAFTPPSISRRMSLPVLLIIARTARVCATVSYPPIVTVPESAGNRVDAMPTVVVLPEPFGPSRAVTLPAGISRSMPSRTRCPS